MWIDCICSFIPPWKLGLLPSFGHYSGHYDQYFYEHGYTNICWESLLSWKHFYSERDACWSTWGEISHLQPTFNEWGVRKPVHWKIKQTWQNINWWIYFLKLWRISKIKEKVINLKTSTSCYEEKVRVKRRTMKAMLAWLLAQDSDWH